jgi:hypothetical protein
MKNENLPKLIAGKWFDQSQDGLRARCLAFKIEYKYHDQKTGKNNSVIVDLKKNGVESKIELYDSGILLFEYSKDDKLYKERFKDCSTLDFHTMIAHGFLYLRDGNFDYHKEWYENLNRI